MKQPLLVIILLCSLQAQCQTNSGAIAPLTLNVGGGSAAITNDFLVDWSIGESTIIETYYGENTFANSIIGIHWNVTSGILQPFDKNHIIYNFLIPAWTNQEIRLYPVPTRNIVTIDFRSVTTGRMFIELLNVNSQVLGTKEFNQVNGNSTQQWDLSNRPGGIYYFHILLTGPDGVVLKQGTFKVAKIK